MIHKVILYLIRMLYLIDTVVDKKPWVKSILWNNHLRKAYQTVIKGVAVEADNYKSQISKKVAKRALDEVGRDALPSFTYFKRPMQSSKSLDGLEELWWNRTGSLIEDIWGMPTEVCEAYRGDYAQKAKNFFKEGKKHVKILDLGCGTGWFGRLIAGNGLFYEGIDFSETQIQIAKEKSIDFPYQDHLNFCKTTDFTKIKDISEYDGIIINAFLHHLYEDELNELFSAIKNTFRSGTKIFIMEPVYPTNKAEQTVKAIIDDMKNQTIGCLVNSIKSRAIHSGDYDISKENDISSLIAESNRNGFFFSPKETAFTFGEFNSLISEYCSTDNYFYVGYQDLHFMQTISLIKDESMRKSLISEVYPLIKKLDTELIDNGYFFNKDKNYIFTCFECRLK